MQIKLYDFRLVKYITIVNHSLPFTEIPEMERGRLNGGSVALNNTTLWITGGIITTNSPWQCTNTTEFLKFNHSKSIPGPILPRKCLKRHCLTKLNESMVIITGGYPYVNEIYLVDIFKNFSIIKGPPLLIGRHDHSCGTFKLNDKTMVIVSGGTGNSRPINSTELWDPTSQDGWAKGKVVVILMKMPFG